VGIIVYQFKIHVIMRLYKKTRNGLLCFCLSFLFYYSSAQSLNQPIPFDPDVRTGTLSNGLKYYIKKNLRPEKKVELRLVVNAGALEEDNNQQGLAHFVEHMAFNGSKNFKKNELINYLQLMGVQFGAHLNAYTNQDETVYRLLLPTDKKGVVDKGFLILKDWAHQLSFDHKEIDKERQVVIEELRTRQGVVQRWQSKYFPLFFNHSKYAQRTVIGSEKILKTFDYGALKKFYRDWYRPDLMAVIVVGDVDVTSIEQKIKARFSAIKPVKNARPKKKHVIRSHKKPLVAIYADKEMPYANIELSYQQRFQPTTTFKGYRQYLIRQLALNMFNQRLEELTKQANIPFNEATFSFEHIVKTLAVYQANVRARDQQVLQSLKAFLIEKKRVEQFGFTKEELVQYKKIMQEAVTLVYKQRENNPSGAYVEQYIDHFLNGNPSLNIQLTYSFINQQLPTITLAEIHDFVKNWTNNHSLVVGVALPKSIGQSQVTKKNVLEVLNSIEQMEVIPYKSQIIHTSKSFLDDNDLPKVGKIVSSKTYKQNITTLRLTNGIKIVLKPTKFVKDQIVFEGYSKGGYSVLSAQDQLAALCAPEVMVRSGVGRLSFQQMKRMLSTSSLSFAPYINELSEGFKGAGSGKDLKTLLQLIHLYFTQPRQDSVAFRLWLEEQKNIAKNMMNDPSVNYQNAIYYTLAQGHPRREKSVWSVEDYDKVSLDQIMRVYKERFADPNNFIFTFVGDFDMAKLKPLLEKYLGSLPVKQRSESFKDLGIRPPTDLTKKVIYKGSAPQSFVTIGFAGETPHNQKKLETLRLLKQMLDIKFSEKLREEKSLIYNLVVSIDLNKSPYNSYKIGLIFPCAPQNTQQVHDIVLEEIKKIQEKGIANTYLVKAKEAIQQEKKANLKENGYWLSVLTSHSFYDQSFEDVDNVVSNEITTKDIQRVVKELMDVKRYIHVVLYPEHYKK
jgi:zinc protease